MNWMIVMAGGRGLRTQLKFNKIFFKINKKPIIYWCLKNLVASNSIDKIIISARKEDVFRIKAIIDKEWENKIEDIVSAKSLRQKSTLDCLSRIKKKYLNVDNDLIGVHNAVNLFIKEEEIVQVYQAAQEYGAALLALPAKDTVKIANDDGLVRETPLRKYCYYAQTPQVSSFSNLWQAVIKANEDNFIGTDETQLLERIGVKVKIVPCSSFNFKITFPQDLVLANYVFRNFFKKWIE